MKQTIKTPEHENAPSDAQTGAPDVSLLSGIVTPLLDWYAANARALPWRENADPYRVWVSEIMLQQTQVGTVIPYYARFMRAVPDVRALAELDENELLKLWEGLGYYGRARNLHKAARAIVEKHGGRFPEDYAAIRALPGVGDYTAGAIASISFGQAAAAVDGNVLRVVSRLTASRADVSLPLTKARVSAALTQIYPAGRCGDFTQSLMELGAVICLPGAGARCGLCPLRAQCRAAQTGAQVSLPVKAAKKPRKKEKKTVFILRYRDRIALRRRAENVLLGGLWEFPNVDGDLSEDGARATLENWGVRIAALAPGVRKKHVFTHVEWDMASFVVDCAAQTDGFVWVTQEERAAHMALPSAFRGFV